MRQFFAESMGLGRSKLLTCDSLLIWSNSDSILGNRQSLDLLIELMSVLLMGVVIMFFSLC